MVTNEFQIINDVTQEKPLLSLNLLDGIDAPTEGMKSNTLANDANMKIVLFAFAPRHQLAAHAAPFPATIQILSGDATLTLGNHQQDVSAGFLVYMPPGQMHGVLAKTSMKMLLTLHKASH
jgi:quercetin dioxygenase-like cupin family protein